MNTNNSSQLSLIHPDDIDSTLSPVSNMPFDESLEFRNSDYMSSEAMEISDETNYELEHVALFIRDNESFNNKMIREEPELFNLLPPSPPTEDEINEIEEKTYNNKLYSEFKNFNINSINLGNGKMDYISNNHDKLMMTNAWQAISQTKTWDFVAQDIPSFMFSNDPRITLIINKMSELGYNEHSGCSFGCTMRNMQYLVKYGEENFKKIYMTPQLPKMNPI